MTGQSAGAAGRAFDAARRHVLGRRALRLAVGFVLVGIGLLGLLMPLLPGWLLIFVGLAVIGVKHPFVERLKERVREKAQPPSRGRP